MYDIVITKGDLLQLGGIETWLINLARRHGKTHKMLLLYRNADYRVLKDVAEHCEVAKYTGQAISAKRAVYCYDLFAYGDIEAKEEFYAVHADYREIKWHLVVPEGMKPLAVSEVARQGLLETKGIDSEVVYNPVDVSRVKPLLRLVSGTRLSEEKGLGRMLLLDKALQASGVLYEWHIFTSHPNIEGFSDNVVIRKPTRDLLSYVAQYDYLVQLSDTESYGYSIVESLTLGKPVVMTDIPVRKELGITDKHAVIIPLDEKDYKKYSDLIIKGGFKVKYTPPADKWGDVFGKGSGSDYEYPGIAVKNIYGGRLTLMAEGLELEEGEEVVLFDKNRVADLVGRGYISVL